MECIQLSLFGRMYPELSAPTVERTSELCWKSLPAWHSQMLQFLDLRGGGGGGGREIFYPFFRGFFFFF